MSRHECRDAMPPAAVDGSVAQCPACEAWWQYVVTEHELGSNRRWRRVRWWMLFARHAVEQERTRRAIYEAFLGVSPTDVPVPDAASPWRSAYDAALAARSKETR